MGPFWCVYAGVSRDRDAGGLLDGAVAPGGLRAAAAGLAWIYFEGRPTTFEAPHN